MTTHNEQTLRPIDGMVKEFDEMMHTGYHKDIKVWLADTLTTDRDAAYTMLREAVKSLQVNEDMPSSWHRENAHGYNEALSDILTLLDTTYGKTHTV